MLPHNVATQLLTSAMPHTAALVWFRNDLRLVDHQPLLYALQQQPSHMVPFSSIERSQLLARPLPGIEVQGPPQVGPHRCRYGLLPFAANYATPCRALLQALHALQHDLQARGSNLAHQVPGNTPAFVAELVHSLPPCQRILLVHHQQWGSAALERAVANSFIAAAKSRGCAGVQCVVAYSTRHRVEHIHVESMWGATLHHPDDLPYATWSPSRTVDPTTWRTAVNDDPARFACCPDTMTAFRKALKVDPASCVAAAETMLPQAPLRPPMPAPVGSLPPFPPDIPHGGPLPSTPAALYAAVPECAAALDALHTATGGMTAAAMTVPFDAPPPAGSAFPFTVDEASAMQRLRYYLGLEGDDNHDSSTASPRPAPVQGYKDARMQAVGVDSSTKLSPFLALGVLCPRTVAAEVLRAREAGVVPSQGGPGETFDWLLMHLAIRCVLLLVATCMSNMSVLVCMA